jgi:hypothetical protein
VPCLPSKRFDELYRLYRSLQDRYLSTVVGGQCVANKHDKSPLLVLSDVFVWIVLPFGGRGDIFCANFCGQSYITLALILLLQLLPIEFCVIYERIEP